MNITKYFAHLRVYKGNMTTGCHIAEDFFWEYWLVEFVSDLEIRPLLDNQNLIVNQKKEGVKL